jgi:hypothetical protein
VTGPGAPSIATTGDLSGQTVHVRQQSAYRESLEALNATLKGEYKYYIAYQLAYAENQARRDRQALARLASDRRGFASLVAVSLARALRGRRRLARGKFDPSSSIRGGQGV